MRAFHIWIPGGDAGTASVISWMKKLAVEGKRAPSVRQAALNITAGIPGRDGLRQIHAIRNWLASTIAFTRDPEGQELLYTPQRALHILTTRGPPLRLDCDDVAMLAAALGGSVGLRSRFQVVGFLSPNAPYRHVWADLQSPTGGPWVQMDVTRTHQPLPMDAAITRRKIVRV
jgi:hypothetical protein